MMWGHSPRRNNRLFGLGVKVLVYLYLIALCCHYPSYVTKPATQRRLICAAIPRFRAEQACRTQAPALTPSRRGGK